MTFRFSDKLLHPPLGNDTHALVARPPSMRKARAQRPRLEPSAQMTKRGPLAARRGSRSSSRQRSHPMAARSPGWRRAMTERRSRWPPPPRPAATHRLTNSSGCVEDNLAWSPDSKELAFTSNCAGGPNSTSISQASPSDPLAPLHSPPADTLARRGEQSRLLAGRQADRLSLCGGRNPPCGGARCHEALFRASSERRVLRSSASPRPTRPAAKSARSPPPICTSTNSTGLRTRGKWSTSRLRLLVKTIGGWPSSTPQPLSQAEPQAIFDPNASVSAPAPRIALGPA